MLKFNQLGGLSSGNNASIKYCEALELNIFI